MPPRVSLAVLAATVAAAGFSAGPAAAQVADTIPPAIDITVPAEGQVFATDQGNVPTNFACHDEIGGSGLKDPPFGCVGPAFIDTTQHGDQLFTVTATDKANNSAPQHVHYRLVDMIPPQITITAPTAGQHFPLHSTQDTNFDCTDKGESLVDECEGDQNVDTSQLGAHTFNVLATDGDGNRTTMSVPYVVDPVLVFDPDLDHNSQSVLNAAVPALRKLAHASSATISVAQLRPASKVAVRVTGRRGGVAAKGSGRVGANAGVRFALRVKSRRLLRGRVHLFVTVAGTDGRVSRRQRGVGVHR